jgi:hypothetical protein
MRKEGDQRYTTKLRLTRTEGFDTDLPQALPRPPQYSFSLRPYVQIATGPFGLPRI